jgi:hypothetical protein
MESLYSIGWRNEHESGSFPFMSQLISDHGVEVPKSIVVDAQVSILGNSQVVLNQIAISSRYISFLLSFRDGSGSIKELHSACELNKLDDGFSDVIDDNGVSFGKLSYGSNSSFFVKKMISRIYLFKKKVIHLNPSCVMCLGSSHVTGISTVGETFRGSVSLREGDGVEIESSTNNGITTVRFHATGSRGENCCEDDYTPLVSINGINPDALGNLTIKEQDTPEPETKNSLRQVLKVVNIEEGIRIEIV